MKLIKSIVVLSLLMATANSCFKDKFENELAELDQYLIDNSITVGPTSSGIYYIEVKEGSGPATKGGDEVKVRYTGTFLDGEEFDSGVFTFFLGYGQVIPGWDEGIKYMNEAGKATLIIPSNMAYGPNGRGSIPGYSTLLFDVEILDIL